MANAFLDAALAWAGRGFRVFPLKPGTKLPAAVGWRESATRDPDEIVRLWSLTRDYNIGVLCNDMIVVDCDVKNGKAGLASYFDLGLPFDTLAVKTPSGGVHYYLSGPSTRNRADLVDGIDIRSAHGYVVAPGSVLPGVGSYTVLNDAELALAPESFIELIGAPRERSAPGPQVELDTPAAIEAAKDYLLTRAPAAVEGEGGDHGTFAVGACVKDYGVSEDTAYELLLDYWNDGCSPPWEPDLLRVKVENAYAYGTRAPGVLTPEFEFRGVGLPVPEIKPRPVSPWVWQGDDVDFDAQWLIYNRLPRVGTALIVAPSSAGKTFLLAKLAADLARGDPFFGTKPDETVGSVLLMGEGVSGTKGRLWVLSERDRPLPIASRSVSILNTADAFKDLLADLRQVAETMQRKWGARLGMVGIDTLAASGMLGDENSNTDCAAAVKYLERLAIELQCLVPVIHHPSKTGTAARGGSALHAGFDVVVEVRQPGGGKTRLIECTKNRDAPTGSWGAFTLIPCPLGFDAKGREVTTCTVSEGKAEDEAAAEEKAPVHFEAFMDSIEWAQADQGLGKDDPVSRAALRRAFATRAMPGKASGTVTNAFKTCFEWAEANYKITVSQVGGNELISQQRPAMNTPA